MKSYVGVVLLALMCLLTLAAATALVGAEPKKQPAKRYIVKLCDFRLKSGKVVPIYGEVRHAYVRTCYRGAVPYPVYTTDPNTVAMLQQILVNQNALMLQLNAMYARIAASTPAAPAPLLVVPGPSGPAGPPGPAGRDGISPPAIAAVPPTCPSPCPTPAPAPPPIVLPPPVVPVIPPHPPTPGGGFVPVAPPTVAPVAPPTVTPIAPPTVAPVAPPTFVPMPPAAGTRGMVRFSYYYVYFPTRPVYYYRRYPVPAAR